MSTFVLEWGDIRARVLGSMGVRVGAADYLPLRIYGVRKLCLCC
jgi:hypothetical protein